MNCRLRLPILPASFFGIALGLIGMGNDWRIAAEIWRAPKVVAELIMLLGVLVWAVVLILYGAKWLFARPAALAEARHSIDSCFVGLVGVTTMLVALAVLPYVRGVAALLFETGALFTLCFSLWRTGELWKGERDIATNTPVLYLPTATGGFVAATVAMALGYREVAQLAFGAGVFAWLALESVVLHRLYSGPCMVAALRPTLGIQLSPPTVGAVACIGVMGDSAGLVPHAMLGYALLQGLLLLRLLPWICKQAFTPSYWGFAFGTTALSGLTLRLVERGDGALVGVLAPILFLVANLVIALLVFETLCLLVSGRLLRRSDRPAATSI
jgi:tellurite resistance protein